MYIELMHSSWPFVFLLTLFATSIFINHVVLGSEVKLSQGGEAVFFFYRSETGTWNNGIFPSITPTLQGFPTLVLVNKCLGPERQKKR